MHADFVRTRRVDYADSAVFDFECRDSDCPLNLVNAVSLCGVFIFSAVRRYMDSFTIAAQIFYGKKNAESNKEKDCCNIQNTDFFHVTNYTVLW